ncbi:hypothetical protein CAEBREN_17515 [Caenorhabditis brenneri]|uniref:Uncharacterized protein n=1 Tax=Caenorhabditis brenneri TaxID=135651 RepID=G0NJ55_CAEBE|nr:hypothetical protein CAEBREN_17515 [Caenorhabditis brenneri]
MEDSITSKMESRNCSIPAPKLFSDIMHYSHIVSFPVYLATLIILFREKSKIFRTYKWFIIVHVIINIATECYVSLFMLPVTYLPLPMFRCTGWLGQLKAVMILRTKPFFPKFAKWQLNFYRFSIIFHPIIGTVTFSPNVLAQDVERIRLFKAHPSFPPEITCYSVIVAVLDNEMFWVLITFYCCQIVVSVTGSLGPLLYIVKFIKKGLTLSAETAKLQKILVMSLFIQGAIHSIFIITPTFFQIYAMFFELHTTDYRSVSEPLNLSTKLSIDKVKPKHSNKRQKQRTSRRQLFQEVTSWSDRTKKEEGSVVSASVLARD